MTGAPLARSRAARCLLSAAMLGALLAACTGAVGPDGSPVPTAEVPSSSSSGPDSSSESSPSPLSGAGTSSGGETTRETTASSAPMTPSTTADTSVTPTSVTSGSGPRTSTATTTTPAGTTAARTTSARTTTAPTRAPPVTSRPPAATWWRPAVGLSWQWQLTGTVDLTVDATVYDLDMFETDSATVSRLHAMKRHVICYIDVGSWEDFRPDAGAFPESVKGASNGWPGERWLDIRQTDVLRPLMTKRLQQCADKGFDGVEPDLMDGFSNATGFPISAADQLRYNRMIAGIAHSLGLAVGLKGDPEQASVLVSDFDYAINEQCVEFDECGLLRPFIAAGKPVFHVEYDLAPAEFCPVTRPLHFSSMRKHLDLDAWREPC